MMKNTHKRSLGGLALACLGLTTVLGLSACGGGGGKGGQQGAQAPPQRLRRRTPAKPPSPRATPSAKAAALMALPWRHHAVQRWWCGPWERKGAVWSAVPSQDRGARTPVVPMGNAFVQTLHEVRTAPKAPRRSPRFKGRSMRPLQLGPGRCTWRGTSTKRHAGSTPALRDRGYQLSSVWAGHGDQHHRATRQSRRRIGKVSIPGQMPLRRFTG